MKKIRVSPQVIFGAVYEEKGACSKIKQMLQKH